MSGHTYTRTHTHTYTHNYIGVNRTDLGGTVPLLGYSSRCPALHLICHALCSDTLISRIYRVKYAYSGSMHGLSM